MRRCVSSFTAPRRVCGPSFRLLLGVVEEGFLDVMEQLVHGFLKLGAYKRATRSDLLREP
jgi:hypothetical protein